MGRLLAWRFSNSRVEHFGYSLGRFRIFARGISDIRAGAFEYLCGGRRAVGCFDVGKFNPYHQSVYGHVWVDKEEIEEGKLLLGVWLDAESIKSVIK